MRNAHDRSCRIDFGRSAAQDGELEGDHAIWRKQMGHARGKIIEIRDLRQYVIANNKISLPPFRFQTLGEFQAKEFNEGWNIFLSRNFGDISGRLDTRNGDAQWEEMLKQISIIACNFENLTVCVEIEPI